ncbi:MAG: PEP-CTERM sorting domain-containing protein [Gammaproteobacteria bacterium]|nr:PEP-CTERM sorting domain-containing protein [Gammaproteobacteria bacterium]
MKKKIVLLGILAAGMMFGAQTHALEFDFNGNFTNDNDIELLNFTVGTNSNITIFSSSWNEGGFDPILAIWDASTGTRIAEQDDGNLTGSATSNNVSYNYDVWDSFFEVFLTAGNYIASIGQFDNFAVGNNLSDGFLFDADPNFTASFGCSNGIFCGDLSPPSFTNDNRTSNWRFHILNVAGANITPGPGTVIVPEPSTLAILGLGLAGIGFSRKKKVT